MRTSELKKGLIIDLNNEPHMIINIDVKTPSARGAATLYKIRFKNIKTGQNVLQSLHGEEKFDVLQCERCSLQYLYSDNDSSTFMDTVNYTQYSINNQEIDDELLFLLEGTENIMGLIYNDALINIQLPATVALKITECAPGVKGGSATARTKPATLETGLVVQIPDYINQGETIIVNTESKEYSSRA